MKIESVKLLYNAAAHFAAAEKYPGGLPTKLREPGVESYDAAFWAFAECAKQAELWRRFMGENPKKILTEAEWRLAIRPAQIQTVVAKVLEAIMAGLAEEKDDEQEIDEVLLELEKKTGKTN